MKLILSPRSVQEPRGLFSWNRFQQLRDPVFLKPHKGINTAIPSADGCVAWQSRFFSVV